MKRWIIPLFLIIGSTVIVCLSLIRRELPFQEMIVFDDSIAIINARDWYPDNISISISSSNDITAEKLHYAKNGVCIYHKKQNDDRIRIKIERNDLKGRILYKKKIVTLDSKKQTDKYIVLVGASVGAGWHFDKLSERRHIASNIVFGFRPHYFFDKTEIIDKLIAIPAPVYGVIIKECSAYFPHDVKKNINLVNEWIIKLQNNNILPVLATVIPVTEHQDQLSPGKMSSLILYNDLIKSLASTKKLPLLDLEKALRINNKNRHLRNKFAQKDGTHLTPAGYVALDNMMAKKSKHLFEIEE